MKQKYFNNNSDQIRSIAWGSLRALLIGSLACTLGCGDNKEETEAQKASLFKDGVQLRRDHLTATPTTTVSEDIEGLYEETLENTKQMIRLKIEKANFTLALRCSEGEEKVEDVRVKIPLSGSLADGYELADGVNLSALSCVFKIPKGSKMLIKKEKETLHIEFQLSEMDSEGWSSYYKDFTKARDL